MVAIAVPVPQSAIGTVDSDTGQIILAREWYRFFGMLQMGVGGDTSTLSDAETLIFGDAPPHSDVDQLRHRIDEIGVHVAGTRNARSDVDALRRSVNDGALQFAAGSARLDYDGLRRRLRDVEILAASVRAPASAAVSSVFGRTGVVVAASGDYASSQLSDVTVPTSFTPVLKIGGATTGITYSSQIGRYTTLNKTTTFHITIGLTSKGSATGALTVNLPVATDNTTGQRPQIAAVQISGTFTGTAYGTGAENSTAINLNVNNGGTQANLTDTNITNTSNIYISGSYISA